MFSINIFYLLDLVHLITAELRQLYKQKVNSTWLSLLLYASLFAIFIITSLFFRFKRVNTHLSNASMRVKCEKAFTIKIWTPGKGRLFRVVRYSYLINIFGKRLNFPIMHHPSSINSKHRLENRGFSETVCLHKIS